MKLTPEELPAQGYIILDEINHKDLIPFVKKFLRQRTIASIFYYFSNAFFVTVLLLFFIKCLHLRYLNINDGLTYISLGVGIAFLLIPVHELLHALAYKSLGARQTSYDVNLKKFYFLAIADKFVANKNEFKIVALAPFIIISLGFIIALFFTNKTGILAILTAMMIHTSFCSGDFALLSFFEVNKKKDVVTYDDKENKISFFYGKDKLINADQSTS